MSKMDEMSLISYRAMIEADIPEVVAIEQASFDTPWTLGIFRDCLKVGYDCWVFEQNNRFLGYLIFSRALNECHILNFAIQANSRKAGLGTEAMGCFIEFCIKNQIVDVFLEVRENNRAATGLYEKLGFVATAVRKDYYRVHGGTEDAVLMQLRLENKCE